MTTPAEPLIEVRDLRHEIDGRCVMAAPPFSAAKGEHTLLLGPSLITPTSGEVRIAGQVMSALPAAQRDQLRRRTIGVVFQTLRLISALSVRQNLALAQRLALGANDPEAIEGLIAQVGLSHRADARPRALSQGEGQRAAIARALCARPAIVVADEPTSALDDANAAAMSDLLLATAEATGATLLIATHDNRLKARFDRTLNLSAPQVAV